MQSRYAAALFAIFALGGVALAFAAAFSKDRRKLAALYFLEIAQVGVVLVPAALGAPYFDLAIFALVLLCSRELWRGLAAARVAFVPAMLAVGLAGAGALAILRIGHASFPLLALGYSLVEINDTAAWAAGSALGKHKLWPALSPNKTWEGVAGGVAASAIFACVLRFLAPDWPIATLLGGALLLALAGTAGDLLASAVKRRAGWRNYADWIPYQGGVLDLYDSFLFAAPPWLLYLLATRTLP